MVPDHDELYELVVGRLDLTNLKSCLYPMGTRMYVHDDVFSDYSGVGFLEQDTELLSLVAEDWQTVLKLGSSHREIAEALVKLMEGRYQLHPDYEYHRMSNFVIGSQSCPWGCSSSFVRGNDHGEIVSRNGKRSIKINTMHPHLIQEHFFFQGKGVSYRLDPQEIIPILMLGNEAKKITQHLCNAFNCKNREIKNYALTILKTTSSELIKKAVIPDLQKLIKTDDLDILYKTLTVIKDLSIRELGENIAGLLDHPNISVQVKAEQILEEMEFIVRPVFFDLKTDSKILIDQLLQKLQENDNVEEVIEVLGKLGEETPEILNFFNEYPEVTTLALLRIIKELPSFITHLQRCHWRMMLAVLKTNPHSDKIYRYSLDELNDEKKSKFKLGDTLNQIIASIEEEDLLFYLTIAALRFRNSATKNFRKKVFTTSFRKALKNSISLSPKQLNFLRKHLPQSLRENQDQAAQNLISIFIKKMSEWDSVIMSSHSTIESLIEFVQQTCDKKDPANWRLRRAWINIMIALESTTIKRDEIAAIAITHLNDDDLEIRLQALKTIRKSKCNEALDTFIELVNSRDLEIQREALKAIAELGTAAEKAVETLLLKNKELVISTLFSIGSKQCVPTLLEYLEEKNYNESKYLWQLQFINDNRIMPTLLNKVTSTDKVPSNLVKYVFQTIQLRELQNFWQNSNQQQQRKLIKEFSFLLRYTTRKVSNICEIFLSNWQENIASDDEDLRLAIVHCISYVITQENAADFAPKLIEALQDKKTREEAAGILSKVEWPMVDMVEFFVDADFLSTSIYCKILRQIGSNNSYGLPRFLELLDQGMVQEVIPLLKPLGDVAIDALYKLTEDKNIRKARTATFALAMINCPRCVSYLAKLISHPDTYIQTCAALQLSEYKKYEHQAIKVFLDALQNVGKKAEIALSRLSLISDQSLENLEAHLVELIFATASHLKSSIGRNVFFKLTTHSHVCKVVLKQKSKYWQHPQKYILDVLILQD